MADETPTGPGDAGLERDGGPRDEQGMLSGGFVDAVAAAVAERDAPKVRALAGSLAGADLAELIAALEPEAQAPFVQLLGEDFDYAVLTELDEGIRVRIVEELPSAEVAEGVADLESDDAVYILEDLGEEERARILEQIPLVDRDALRRSLEYPEESAGRRMQTEFIAVPPFWTVGQTIDHLGAADDLPDEFYEIFVVDPGHRLLGTVPLNRLLRARRGARISDLMGESRHLVHATEDQEEVARLFERYNLVSAAVVDDAERLVGVITIDDIVDVIQAEADEDIKRLAGVGDEEISDSILAISRSRLPWLVVNSVTAFLSASVIGLFDGTIAKMVALAILMPIVASVGGNTGTQAMTVTVRALATRDLSPRNRTRIIVREAVVALLNGFLVAALVGSVAAFWFGNLQLGGVIAAALVINMLVAGLVGVLVPLTLNRLRADPAVASGVFVTTCTDVVGFFSFLGLATVWFRLF